MKEVSNKKGRTVLFVSHTLPSIMNLCNNCLLLENGLLKEQGDATIVVANYMKINHLKSIILNGNSTSISDKALPYFRLTAFYFNNIKSGDVLEASDNRNLEIIIEGEILKYDNRFNIGYSLKNELGYPIIISFSTDQPEENWLDISTGPIRIKTSINTSVLNEGKYEVFLLASLHCIEMLYTEEDNLRLDFGIIGNRGNSPYWINKRNSILAPFVRWQHKIDD